MRQTIAVALLLTSACSQPKDAKAADQHIAAAYDIAGVRPGMSVDEAGASLQAHGFAITNVPGQSWENAVAIAVARAQGNPVPTFGLTGGIRRIEARKGGEKITIEPIRPGPRGGIVMFVSYTVPLASHPIAQVEADSVAKFGRPSRRYPDGTLMWCSSGSKCEPRAEVQPWLELSTAGPNAFISLSGGTSTEARAAKVLADAVAAKVGRSQSSF